MLYTVQSYGRGQNVDEDVAGRAEPPRRGRGPRRSVADVVEAALALADADGLEAVTMRAVAERLGTSPMSLYTYVPGKAELLDLMLDALYLAMPRSRFGSSGARGCGPSRRPTGSSSRSIRGPRGSRPRARRSGRA